jgi:hypothetical protein
MIVARAVKIIAGFTVIVEEIKSNNKSARAIVFARTGYSVFVIVVNYIFYFIGSGTIGDLGDAVFIVVAVICRIKRVSVGAVVCYLLLQKINGAPLAIFFTAGKGNYRRHEAAKQHFSHIYTWQVCSLIGF